MIREIREEEFSIIQELIQKYFHTNISEDPFMRVLVYEKDRVKAFLSYSFIYERAEINYIYVSEEMRGNGIASKLMAEMIRRAKLEKIETISLEVEISNVEAIKLYEKYGFQKKAIRKEYYKGKDGYLMVKDMIV